MRTRGHEGMMIVVLYYVIFDLDIVVIFDLDIVVIFDLDIVVIFDLDIVVIFDLDVVVIFDLDIVVDIVERLSGCIPAVCCRIKYFNFLFARSHYAPACVCAYF